MWGWAVKINQILLNNYFILMLYISPDVLECQSKKCKINLMHSELSVPDEH